MFVRPLSVAAVGVLALGAAVMFGSGCDQLEELVKDVEAHHGGSGGAMGSGPEQPGCTSSNSCAPGEYCTTEDGICNGCGANASGACPAVCFGTCQKKPTPGVACGKITCAAGQICCSASCGICGSADGACPAIACQDPPPPPVDCMTDADCTLAADYCHGGCDCTAHGKLVGLTACQDPVQCLVDPCARKTAVCVNNKCAAADAPVR